MAVDGSVETVMQEVANNTEMEGKYLTFWTDKQVFGVPIADVVQIISIQKITEVPEFPMYAKGIINLRGSIVPIIDVRLRLGKEEAPYDAHTCIIVTSIKGHLVGLIVDSVDEVTNIPDEEISQPPRVSRDLNSAYLTGIGKHERNVILLLDTQKILSLDQLEAITQTF